MRKKTWIFLTPLVFLTIGVFHKFQKKKDAKNSPPEKRSILGGLLRLAGPGHGVRGNYTIERAIGSISNKRTTEKHRTDHDC